jgi:hypothetical protein
VTCDFCGAVVEGIPVDRFMAKRGVAVAHPSVGVFWNSHDDWIACVMCARMVKERQWRELAVRVLEVYADEHPTVRAIVQDEGMVELLVKTYKNIGLAA